MHLAIINVGPRRVQARILGPRQSRLDGRPIFGTVDRQSGPFVEQDIQTAIDRAFQRARHLNRHFSCPAGAHAIAQLETIDRADDHAKLAAIVTCQPTD
jgi:hypothetical protein